MSPLDHSLLLLLSSYLPVSCHSLRRELRRSFLAFALQPGYYQRASHSHVGGTMLTLPLVPLPESLQLISIPYYRSSFVTPHHISDIKTRPGPLHSFLHVLSRVRSIRFIEDSGETESFVARF